MMACGAVPLPDFGAVGVDHRSADLVPHHLPLAHRRAPAHRLGRRSLGARRVLGTVMTRAMMRRVPLRAAVTAYMMGSRRIELDPAVRRLGARHGRKWGGRRQIGCGRRRGRQSRLVGHILLCRARRGESARCQSRANAKQPPHQHRHRPPLLLGCHLRFHAPAANWQWHGTVPEKGRSAVNGRNLRALNAVGTARMRRARA